MARFPLAVRHLQALAALTALAAFLRFSTLGTQSYWYDEAVTVQLVRRSLSGMLSAIPGSESTPPLYYVLAWGWSRLFGTGDVGLRSLSAVFGTATVPAAYAAARVFVSRRTSLVAAALLAVSPFLVWYSQEARAYAVFVFFGTLSLALVGRAADPSASRSLAWWALSAALALATHYFALFLVAPEAAWLLYRSVDRRATVKAVAIVAAVGAALLPLALYQSRYTEHTAWISTGGLGGRAAYLLHQLVIGAYPTSYIRPLIVAVPVVVSVGLFAWTERSERDGALLALAFGIVAVGAPFALALVGDLFFGGRGDYFLFRNLIVATVPLTIVAATVLGTERAGKAGLLACALVCSLLVAVSIDISRRPDLQRPDVRAVAAVVGSPPGLRAILLDPRTSLPLRLYLPRLEDLRQQGAYLREIDVVEETNNANSPQADRSPPPGFRRIETRHVVQGFTIVRLQSLRRRRVTAANLVGEFPNHRFLAILLAPRD
jgi:mannosyltransferase